MTLTLAIFGISNGSLNLVVSLIVLFLVVVWLALIYWTYADASRRIEDPVLVGCATAASLFPYVGTVIYTILRPPDFLEDARERDLEIRAAELRVRQLSEQACPHCEFPIERSYLRCPNCQRRLRSPCQSCGKPLDPRWGVCPYCESEVPGRQQRRRDPREPRPPATRRSSQERAPAPRPPREEKREPRDKPPREPRRAPAKARAEERPPRPRRAGTSERQG